MKEYGSNIKWSECKPAIATDSVGHILSRMTTAQLLTEREKFQAKIDGPENDGRATTSSSASLDYWMDCVEEIDVELKRRGV